MGAWWAFVSHVPQWKGERVEETISAARTISTLRVDDILRGAQDDIRRRAADLELKTDGELEDGIEADFVGEVEEVAELAVHGGGDIALRGFVPAVGFGDEVAAAGGFETAASHVVEAEVDGVVKR